MSAAQSPIVHDRTAVVATAATFLTLLIGGVWYGIARGHTDPTPVVAQTAHGSLGWPVVIAAVLLVARMAFALGRKRQRAADTVRFFRSRAR